MCKYIVSEVTRSWKTDFSQGSAQLTLVESLSAYLSQAQAQSATKISSSKALLRLQMIIARVFNIAPSARV